MIDDIIFTGGYFFIELPIFSSGNVLLIEAQTVFFEVRLPDKEQISIF